LGGAWCHETARVLYLSLIWELVIFLELGQVLFKATEHPIFGEWFW